MAPLTAIGIVGLGTIGGSLARALAGDGTPVLGWSDDPADVAAACDEGLAARSWREPPLPGERVDTFLIAVPVDGIAGVARQLMSSHPDVLVLHAGGLQRPEALGLDGRIGPYGTHPLAGSHRSGFHASSPDLFRDATVFAESRIPMDRRRRVESLWNAAGARVAYVDADAHDRAMSWVSHLPQLGAVALAAALEERRLDPALAGPGLRDATRLAMSSLMMWRSLLDRAPADTAAALGALERTVAALRSALEEGDQEIVAEMWSRARRWRLSLEDARDAR